jgi:hypothetical protein
MLHSPSLPLSLSENRYLSPADRSRALLAALGVLAELDAKHGLTGYSVELAVYDTAPRLKIWASAADIEAIFPSESHAGEWYADDTQRNLTRSIRGVSVTAVQTREDLSTLAGDRAQSDLFDGV